MSGTDSCGICGRPTQETLVVGLATRIFCVHCDTPCRLSRCVVCGSIDRKLAIFGRAIEQESE